MNNSKKIDDGGPAFGGTRRVPKPYRYDENEGINYIDQHYPGNLSLRDYFATHAILTAASETQEAVPAGAWNWFKMILRDTLHMTFLTVRYRHIQGVAEQNANRCYAIADAMLRARATEPVKA